MFYDKLKGSCSVDENDWAKDKPRDAQYTDLAGRVAGRIAGVIVGHGTEPHWKYGQGCDSLGSEASDNKPS